MVQEVQLAQANLEQSLELGLKDSKQHLQLLEEEIELLKRVGGPTPFYVVAEDDENDDTVG